MKDYGNFWQKKPNGANAEMSARVVGRMDCYLGARPSWLRGRRDARAPRTTPKSVWCNYLVAGLLLILGFIPPAAATDIFHWHDGQGQSHYADHPAQGARQFVLPQSTGAAYSVKRVYDGDTIQLVNGEKVRFLAINTPEIESPRKAGEAGGEEAKQWLQARLNGKTVRLEADVEARDHYGRLLAHVYADNGEHINLSLVRQGLAFVDVHPPNLKHVTELLAAEQEAEHARLGIWNRPDYALKPLNSLNGQSPRGWQRLSGRPTRIEETRTYRKLVFGDTFEANIPKSNVSLFPPLESYLNQTLEIRGWLYRYQARHAMQLRHPAAIRTLKDSSRP